MKLMILAFTFVVACLFPIQETQGQDVKAVAAAAENAQASVDIVNASAPKATAPRIRLKNGDFVEGDLVAVDSDAVVGWKSPQFREALEIPIDAIRGFELIRNLEQPAVVGGWTIEMHSGDRVTGEIEGWDNNGVSIRSTVFGVVQLPAAAISRVVRNNTDMKWIYQGPRDVAAWKPFSGDTAWTMQGGALASSQIGSRTIGAVQLPEKAAVDLRLSWEGKPGFVIAFGVDETASNINSSFRIETWQNQLVLVRQAQGKAEIAELEEISDNQQSLELSIYFDQLAERLVVYSGYGKLLADFKLPNDKPKAHPGVALANHCENLRLDRLRVREWTMPLPADRDSASNYVLKINGESVTGNVLSANPTDGWVLSDKDQSITIAWNEISEIIQQRAEGDSAVSDSSSVANSATDTKAQDNQDDQFAELFDSLKAGKEVLPEEKPGVNKSGLKPAEAAKEVSSVVYLEFLDGSRWKGEWKKTTSGEISFVPQGTGNEIKFPLTALSSFRGSSKPWVPETVEGRRGAVLGDHIQLEGILVRSESKEGVLGWKALVASKSATLIVDTNARIDFRGRTRRTTSDSKSAAVQAVVINRNGQETPTEPVFNLKQLQVPSITLRSGDAFSAELTSVGEKGITFRSDRLATTELPNENVQSIELKKLRSNKIPTAKKVERLLTVPRNYKNDPPTHVLISIEGDFLRGRLLSIDSQFAVMEVRLEQVKVPMEKVAQIVWLHERNWPAKATDGNGVQDNPAGQTAENPAAGDNSNTAANPTATNAANALPPGGVVAMLRNGLRMSLIPDNVSGSEITGSNPLLGACHLLVTDIDLLLLGPGAKAEASAVAENPWKLTLAKSPMEPPEDDGSGGAGNQSPLVGQPAPEIELETSTGERFKLSELKGKVVVLDFWASWCGPCMQTMPEVDKIVAEFPAEQVELIAVNLEEPADRAQSAMERLKLHTKVVLDIDGVAAQRYEANAIPQTVIIDRDGVVKHVFVGGGMAFLKSFKQSLTDVVTPPATDVQ